MMRNAVVTQNGNGFDEEQGDIEPLPQSALAASARAELDVQITTARAYPRSIAKFKATAQSMATLDEETAASCFYTLPRSDKAIEGPSVRLSEIVATAWGNLRFGTRVVMIDERFITAQGVCHDLERNIAVTIEVQRRITNKHGKRFNDDMIQMTGNAACSIALRNAVFKVVPKAYWQPVYNDAKKTAVGEIKTLVQRRTAWFAYFHRFGVTDERILATLGKPSLDDVGQQDVLTLIGLKTAIADGATTIDDAFPPPAKDPVAPPVGKSTFKKPVTPAAASAPAPAPEPERESRQQFPDEPQAIAEIDRDAEDLRQRFEMARTLEEVAAIEADVSAIGKAKKYGQRWIVSFVPHQAAAVKRIEAGE